MVNKWSPVAQSVEQMTVNHWVGGSSPSRGANFKVQYKMNYTLALKDITNSVKKWRIWYNLALFDIKAKYQRTKLGPIWIVLVNLVFVAGISLVWSTIQQTDVRAVLPRFFAGFITWQFMASFVLEGCEIYSTEKKLISNIPMEKFLFQLKNAAVQLNIYLHNILGFYLVMTLFGKWPNFYSLLLIPSLILTLLCGMAVSLILSFFVARFRDLSPLIKSLMSVGMLVTPVLWDASQFGAKYYLVYLNPFAIFLDLVRKPLLGHPLGLLEVCLALAVTTIISLCAFFLFARFRHRIIYWL